MARLGMSPRSLSVKLIGLGTVITLLLLTYTLSSFDISSRLPNLPFFSDRKRSSCPAHTYANGTWTHRPLANATRMTGKEDALAFSGFEGCASSREYYWHLASDKEEQWDRFPEAQSWVWSPGKGCDVRPLVPEAMVKDLVEQGGWLLLGDSITEVHFFSLSCLLYPHVIATPNYTAHSDFDRAWPQNLYLNPESPLLSTLSLPPGYNISGTPLVTFRRVDLLLTAEDLVNLHRSQYNPPQNFSLFSEERFWTLGPDEYMDIFTAPLPQANYGTLIVSTAGHWTTSVFSGFRNESEADSGYGIDGVIEFFGKAMTKWAGDVQTLLFSDQRKGGYIKGGSERGKKGARQVVVRSYLPGHEECHDWRAPWAEIRPFRWNWYNWGSIDDFNRVFQGIASSPKYPDINYIPIERPGRLRPDAHTTGDCLHIMAGAGVLEGWSHYIWHFVTRELKTRR